MSTAQFVTINKNDLAGSRLRCLILTSLPKRQIADTLSQLVSPIATIASRDDRWMPRGFADPKEAKLGECDALLTPAIREELTSWWLVHPAGANTPNWDLASTCTIGGKQGLILVEAKAHDTEPKTLGKVSRFSSKSVENHDQIGTAINEANAALNGICPGWAITRDSHYQLSNRIAWAWKIASLGIPVILVYLGFLNAEEMANCGKPFRSAEEWRRSILDHAEGLVPETVWEQRIQTTGAPMWALIRSLDLSWVVAGIS